MSKPESESEPTPDEYGTAQSESEFESDPVEAFDDAIDMDLRSGADDCYKCSTCDTSCPVAEVDDEFPGPKFQGPEQWRLKRGDDHDIDPSITDCSNCMRCDNACPSSVPLSQMHNTARGEYVEGLAPSLWNAEDAIADGEYREALSYLGDIPAELSIEFVRNRVLSNYGTMAGLGSKFPRLTNFVMSNRITKEVNDRLLGITGERDFPEFADQTFREWWRERGGPKVESADKRVVYFHGDYSNYNTPEVAKAMVRVYERFGYEIRVPTQRCSGTPMFANGMLRDARRAAEVNVTNLGDFIDRGYDVIASCTSCSMALRQEYPELFDFEETEKVSVHTYEALEYLRIHEDLEGELRDVKDVEFPDLAYHAPCHARNQGISTQAVELLSEAEGFEIEDVGDSCSGISGTYGWKTEKYDKSMQIGEDMFEHMRDAEGDTGLTECPTCAMQMGHGTGYEIRHPLEVLEAALVN
jgi:glycerol-3-phosphate dehydrogenase subunit C